MKQVVGICFILILALGAGVFFALQYWQKAKLEHGWEMVGDGLEFFDGEGGHIALSEIGENGVDATLARWKGKLLLVNFWGTWCAPCRKEMPILQTMRNRYREDGFEVIGIALDTKENILRFTKAIGGIDFPLLYGDEAAIKIAKILGNQDGRLPYSVIIDVTGRVRLVKQGTVAEAAIEYAVKKWLKPNV